MILIGNSRGGNAIRNYIQNGGGDSEGQPCHPRWRRRITACRRCQGCNEGNEFSGTGPFLQALNTPKNAAGDEVIGPGEVADDPLGQQRQVRAARRPAGSAAAASRPTSSYAAPELKGATNVVIPRIDHRETAFSPAAFEATYRFITGQRAATLDGACPRTRRAERQSQRPGRVVHRSGRPATFANNLPLPGAQLEIFAIDPATGERRGAAAYTQGGRRRWHVGPVHGAARHALRVRGLGARLRHTHIYRSPFPRSSDVVNMRPERIADADKSAPAIVNMTRPRGYFDPARDKMSFDGQSPPPGAVPVPASRVRRSSRRTQRLARWSPNSTASAWLGALACGEQGHVTTLELTY